MQIKRGVWMVEHYHKFTDYRRYADFKKLDFIVSSIRHHFNRSDLKGLDIGCGKGNVTYPLASLGYKMIGIDISPDDLGAARSKQIMDNDIIFLFGDAENLPLKEEKFDFVVCSEIIEHLNHLGSTLRSINSVLKKNGLLIVTVPNGYGPYCLTHDFHLYSSRLNAVRNKIIPKIFPKIQPSPHTQLFTQSKISKLIKEAGFEIVNINNSDFISFLPVLVRLNKFCYYDCKLADKLPSSLASGFYIMSRKK